MTSFVSGDSVFHDGTPIYNSPMVDNYSEGGIKIDTRTSEKGVNLVIQGDGADKVYTSFLNDIIETGAGDDTVRSGSGNDNIDGGDGNDFIRGGKGDDILRGGKGVDILRGGKGADTFEFKGDPYGGVFGKNSDFEFEYDVFDRIRDFNPNEGDKLVFDLEDKDGFVTYDKGSGEVKVTDSIGGESVVAEIAPDLDVDV